MKKRAFLFAALGLRTAAKAASKDNPSSRIILEHDPQNSGDMLQVFNWSGIIKGQKVRLQIKAGKFQPAKHKLTNQGFWVDGYPSQDGIGANNSITHIRECKVTWDGKELQIAQNVFTSVFSPMLRTPAAPTELTGEIPAHVVTIRPSDSGDSLLLNIPIGGDQSMLITFTLTKSGKVYRSTLIHVL